MNDTIWILILVGLGLFLGYRTALSANKQEEIHSGDLAKLLNYVAAALIATVAPTVICNVLFIHPNFLGEVRLFNINFTTLVHALLIAFLMTVTALILLMVYAILEKPHIDSIAEQEDRGWTREDAETSGL